MKKIIISALFLSMALTPSFTLAQTEDSGRHAPYRATHTKSTELKHTKLKLSFDFNKEHVHGEEWLTASPFFYDSNELVLDAK